MIGVPPFAAKSEGNMGRIAPSPALAASAASPPAERRACSRLPPMSARRIFLVIYACSGAAGLIYEIVWTRLLALQLGHTVAAVGTVLGAFMGGLAAGALLSGHVAPRLDRVRALRSYAAIEVVIAACAVLL